MAAKAAVLARDDIGLSDLPAFNLPVQNVEQLRLQLDNPPCRSDLRPQRCLLDGRQCDIRGQREVHAFALKCLQLGLCASRFYLPPNTSAT